MKKRTTSTCPVALSLDIFGDKWTLVILRDVLLGNKSHFRELLASPEKIASNVLSSKLEALVANGLLTKEVDPRNKSALVYKPTQMALDLLPVLFTMMRWGVAHCPDADVESAGVQMVLKEPQDVRRQVLKRFQNA